MQNSLINNDLLNRVGVDIVLPNYNSYPFIEETIKSIISQTFKNWKLFIVDGNSNIKTQEILKIPKTDSYRQYIAYHEGWGNYKNYKKNKKVILFAKEVKNQANQYRKQLFKCQKRLNRNKYIIF